MIEKELLELFNRFPEDVRRTIARVIEFEQSRISYGKPRFREEIRQIIEEEARDET